MCFEVDPAYPDVMVATHNILCWKRLERAGEHWLSPYLRMMYTFGKEVSSAMDEPDGNEIAQGLHAYSCEGRAERRACMGERVFPAIIPRGAICRYSKRSEELVSTSLAVYRTLKDALAACAQTKVSRARVLPRKSV